MLSQNINKIHDKNAKLIQNNKGCNSDMCDLSDLHKGHNCIAMH